MRDILLLIANIILGVTSIISMILCGIASFVLSSADFLNYSTPSKEEKRFCYITFFICICSIIGMLVMNSIFDNWV